MTVLDACSTLANLHLLGGPHDGSDPYGVIANMLRAVGASYPNPYCAATVSHVFAQANGAMPEWGTASSQAIRRYFEAKAWLSWEPNDLKSWRGCIAGWTNDADPTHGHVFTVTGRLSDQFGNVIGLETLEGDTVLCNEPAGTAGSEFGIWQNRRKVPITRTGHKLWYCNAGELGAYGQYWEAA